MDRSTIQRSDRGALSDDSSLAFRTLLTGLLLIVAVQNSLFAEDTRVSTDSDWPQWRGPRGDGSWHAPKLAETWPKDGLKRLWQAEIGGGYAGVIVADGRVLVMDRVVEREPATDETADEQNVAPIRLEQERLQCFDADTGQRLWSFSYDETYGDLSYGTGPRAAPTVVEGRVYTFGAFGKLHCLKLVDGSPLWSHDVMKEFGGRLPEWGFSASPQIYRDTVIVFAGGLENRCLLAFDRISGTLKWNSLSDQAGYSWPVVVRRPDFDLLVCWTPSHIRGVNAATGEPLWATPYEVTYGVSIATPIVQQDTVLVCGYWHGSKAIRLGATPLEATLQWEENKYLRGLMSQPLARDGYVYLLDKQYGLTCFELATGQKLWDDGNELTPRGRNPQASLVWLNDDDRIIALNSEGELVMARVNPIGYVEQARSKIIDPTWSHPAFAGNRVYARSDTRLVAVELPVRPQ